MKSDFIQRYAEYAVQKITDSFEFYHLNDFLLLEPHQEAEMRQMNRTLADCCTRILLDMKKQTLIDYEPFKDCIRKVFRIGVGGAHISRAFSILNENDPKVLPRVTRRSFTFSIWFGLLDFIVDEMNDVEVLADTRRYLGGREDSFSRTFYPQFSKALLDRFVGTSDHHRTDSPIIQTELEQILEYLSFSFNSDFSKYTPSNETLAHFAYDSTRYMWMLYLLSLSDPLIGSTDLKNLWTAFDHSCRVFSLLDDISDLVEDFSRKKFNYLTVSPALQTSDQIRGRIMQAVAGCNLHSLLETVSLSDLLSPILGEHIQSFINFVNDHWSQGDDTARRFLLRIVTMESQKALGQLQHRFISKRDR